MTKSNGLPCKKCGGSEWYDGGTCKLCSRENYRRQMARRYPKSEPSQLSIQRESERRKEAARLWREQNPERLKAYRRTRNRAHPEKMAEKNHRRITRIKGNGGSFTAADWQAIVEAQNGRCLACGEKKTLTVDHVIPVVKGGRNDASNLQGLCKSCNCKKHTKDTDYRPKSQVDMFKKSGGFLRRLRDKLFKQSE